MKNLGTILGALALIGVIYIGFFKGDSKADDSISAVASDPSKGIRMAYVRSDSLQSQYKYFQELSTELQGQEAVVQKEIEKRQRDFQIEVNLYQQAAPQMNEQQRAASEADLMRVQQQYEGWAREQSDILMGKQQDLQSKMKSDMDSVLVKMKDELTLDFILLYDENSALIYANPDYDITNVVVKKLNENYSKKKAEEGK
jgi:outer membrane protein